MPWCITCAKDKNPEWSEDGDTLHHRRIGIIRYLSCKLKGHHCYL